MAGRFPSRRRFFPRRGGARRQSQVFWSAERAQLIPAAAALSAIDIYNGSVDAELNAVLETEATVHRVLGRGMARATAAGVSLVHVALFKASNVLAPAFGGVLDPGIVQVLTDEDCLYYDTWNLKLGTNIEIPQRIDFDVRVKRRLTTNERLIFVASNAAGGVAIVVDITFRILSKLNV